MSAERQGLLPQANGPMAPESAVRMADYPKTAEAPESPGAPEALEAVPRFSSRWIIGGAAVALTVLVVGGVVIGTQLSDSSSGLSDEETMKGIFDHLYAFEAVSKLHDNSRSVLTGYNASAEYIISALSATNLLVTTQQFQAPIWEAVEPPFLEILDVSPAIALIACPLFTGWQKYQVTCDYGSIRYGGNGNYTLEQPVVYVSDSCNPALYAGFPAGQIVLFEASSACTLYEQTLTAENAGVGGILISNPPGTAGIPRSRVYESPTWTAETQMVQVPCVGVTAAIGTALRQNGTFSNVRMNVVAKLTIADTYNVFAETRTGSADDVVMIGAHLDSVPEGPGINDNGSGSSMILQLAIEFALGMLTEPKRRVRFAWWGAEEIGLVGSNYYVTDLVNNNPAELNRIAGYLNFDMEAGPNYIRMVYDGSTAPENAQNGSMALQALFESAWNEAGSSFDPTPMGGGSDFLPFILAGVPASGTATGASGIKSEGEREVHGGIANAALDPCYHAPCDTAANVNAQAVQDCNFALRKVLETLLDVEAVSLPRRKPPMLMSDFRQMQAAYSRGFHMACDARDEA